MQLHVVCGAGGFIGGHLVRSLLDAGHRVRAVDVKPTMGPWHQVHSGAENVTLDLRYPGNCCRAVLGADVVYDLAADMGGMGFIESHKLDCMLSSLINTNLLLASQDNRVGRYFFASSACVYNTALQGSTDPRPLREEDAYPADPEDGYGWEKLFGERMCRHFREDRWLETRVARLHNVYGPRGTWDGGREKAPAAICRKIARAKLSGLHEVEIWGDGTQARTYTYVDDCVLGIQLVTRGDHPDPVNLGSPELVSVDDLVTVVEMIAGVRVKRTYLPSAPRGVAGRRPDNTLFKKLFDWEPDTRLLVGLERTYRWIYDEVAAGRSGL